MPRSAERYLFDIQDACSRIISYTVGLSFQGYDNATVVRDAVERCLEIIGEALKQALQHHPELANLFPDASDIIGMRNILAHEYGDIDDQRVWQVAIGKVPDLLARVVEERKRREMVNNAKN